MPSFWKIIVMIALIMTIPILISFSIDVCLQFLFVYSNRCQCAGAVVCFFDAGAGKHGHLGTFSVGENVAKGKQLM